MNIGFQTEFASIMVNKDNSENLSLFSISYDYYFHKKNKSLSPFIGGGLGYYICSAFDAGEDIRTHYNNPTCFIRTGFETGKFRTSLNYNFIRANAPES
jgi:outer membrane protein W